MSIGTRKGNAYCVALVHMLTVVTSNVPQIALRYMNTFDISTKFRKRIHSCNIEVTKKCINE